MTVSPPDDTQPTGVPTASSTPFHPYDTEFPAAMQAPDVWSGSNVKWVCVAPRHAFAAVECVQNVPAVAVKSRAEHVGNDAVDILFLSLMWYSGTQYSILKRRYG